MRFALIFIFLGMGFALHWRVGIEAAWPLYAAGAILMLTHLLFGNVWVAFRLLQRGRHSEAARLLERTAFPRLLVRRNRAYYHFARGLLALHAKDFDAGAMELEEALRLGLYRSNDRALAQLNLAHVLFLQKKYGESRKHLLTAESEQPTDLVLKDHLQQLREALAAREN